MIITNTTMFVLPDLVTLSPVCGLRYELDLNSQMVVRLLDLGYETDNICNAFRELFHHIPCEFSVQKALRNNRKWWQFYKSKYFTYYEDKNSEFRLHVLYFINNGTPLVSDEEQRLKHLYNGLSLKTRETIPFHILFYYRRRY